MSIVAVAERFVQLDPGPAPEGRLPTPQWRAEGDVHAVLLGGRLTLCGLPRREFTEPPQAEPFDEGPGVCAECVRLFRDGQPGLVSL